jgi:hypothetical protein
MEQEFFNRHQKAQATKPGDDLTINNSRNRQKGALVRNKLTGSSDATDSRVGKVGLDKPAWAE